MAGHRISATGLAALGATPLLGRLPLAADEQTGAPPTMVLSYPLWQRRFAGRADVINQTVNVDGQPTLILGVMPEGFGLLDNSSDAWFTSGFEPAPGQETQHILRAVGRLKPGVSMSEAQAAVKVALDEYARMFPNRDKGWTVELTPWREARFGGLRHAVDDGAARRRRHAPPLVREPRGAAARAHSLARAVRRSRPGQNRPGVVLTEGLMLALGGGAIGAVVASLGLPALRDLTPAALPRLNDVTFDAGVLAFTVVLCVVDGSCPRDRAGVASLAACHHEGSGWRHVRLGGSARQRSWCSWPCKWRSRSYSSPGTGLAIRAVGDLRGRDVGIDPSGLLSVDVHLPRDPYVTPNVAKVGSIDIAEYNPAGPALYDRIRAALQTMPGVVQAAGVGNAAIRVRAVRAVLRSGTRSTRPTTRSRRSTWPSRKTTSTRWGFASSVAGTSRQPIGPTRPGSSS